MSRLKCCQNEQEELSYLHPVYCLYSELGQGSRERLHFSQAPPPRPSAWLVVMTLQTEFMKAWIPVVDCLIQHQFFIALPSKVAAKAQEGVDIDPVHMLCVLCITAKVELSKEALGSFLLEELMNCLWQSLLWKK